MIVPDVNLLLYAYDATSRFHGAAAAWWRACLSGSEPVGLPPVVVFAFLRVGTSARVFEHPMTPGEAYELQIEMKFNSWVFSPGHRIRLDITSSCFPSFDRNHNTAADQNADATLVPARQAIHHGGVAPTRLVLPWLPNGTR